MVLGSNQYGKPIDMWAVGCIMGEMILGQPVFPGTSTLNQIQKIIELLGKPDVEDKISMKS